LNPFREVLEVRWGIPKFLASPHSLGHDRASTVATLASFVDHSYAIAGELHPSSFEVYKIKISGKMRTVNASKHKLDFIFQIMFQGIEYIPKASISADNAIY